MGIEVYLHMLDHITRPTGLLAPEELQTFANLSRVCRFFADVCLLRMFECVEFSSSIFSGNTPSVLRNDTAYSMTSRESTLYSRIAAKQPLALALAKSVKTCRFTNWTFDETS